MIKIESSDVLLKVFDPDFKPLELLMLPVSDRGEFGIIAAVLVVEVLFKHSRIAADQYPQVLSLDVEVIKEYSYLSS